VEELDPETCAEIRRAIESVQEKLKARGYTNIGSIVEFFGVAPSAVRTSTPAFPALN
jgi:Fur family ferric uptake transcriptional regulator